MGGGSGGGFPILMQIHPVSLLDRSIYPLKYIFSSEFLSALHYMVLKEGLHKGIDENDALKIMIWEETLRKLSTQGKSGNKNVALQGPIPLLVI